MELGIDTHFLEQYINAGPEVSRIHISHNDLDGYGCTAMMDWAMRTLAPDHKDEIKYYNIDAGIDNVNRALSEAIADDDFSTQYMILITDLCVDTGLLQYLQTCGYRINFLIVDHHHTSYKLAQKLHDATAPSSIAEYYVNDSMCATSIMYTMIFSALLNPTMSGIEVRIIRDRLSKVTQYANIVTNFDQGNWGIWSDKSWEEITPEAREYCRFASHDHDKYLADLQRRIFDTEDGDALISEDTAKLYFEYMKEEFRMFAQNVTNVSNVKQQYTMLSDKLMLPAGEGKDFRMKLPRKNIYAYCTSGNSWATGNVPLRNFTMVAKEWLDRNDTPNDVWLLMYVNTLKGVVELRSPDNGVNCAELALLNGGGGHPRAAGFPLK